MNVIWHDLECGSYGEDLELWRELASVYGDPILDVGAGTGRVTLELARRGHRVTALDHDAQLLAALGQRCDGLKVTTVVADARDFALQRLFALCIVPMQTIQLLGGADGRLRFLRCARRHLGQGGLLAISISTELDVFEVGDHAPGPLPDVTEIAGTVYSSRPIAVRTTGRGFELVRHRELVTPQGARSDCEDVIGLDELSADQLQREACAVGLGTLGQTEIPATDEYVGSTVLMLSG